MERFTPLCSEPMTIAIGWFKWRSYIASWVFSVVPLSIASIIALITKILVVSLVAVLRVQKLSFYFLSVTIIVFLIL